MKNLITYLKALWRRGLDSQRKKIGVTLGEATIEHPFSTYSAPFGTCWQPSGKLHSVVRYAAMLVMLFTIGIGNVWGAETLYETITLLDNGTASDGSSSFNASSSTSGVLTPADSVSFTATTSYVYQAQSGLGWKLSSSGSNGTLTFNLAHTIPKVTKIVVNAKRYHATKGTKLNCNSLGQQTLTTSLADYTFTYGSATNISQIVLAAAAASSGDRRCYITTIKIYYDAPAACSTPPTVGSSLSSVSATVNSITATVPISSIGGCNITENGLVYSTSVATPEVGAANCTKVTVTACGSTAANKTVTISDLTCGQGYYVRGYATNAAGTSYTNVTTQSTSACPTYTVTYNAGTGTCGTAQWTQPSYGASTTLPSATAPAACTGYSFAGWCTSSAGSADENTTSPGTILLSGSSYTPTGDITLYAVYTKTVGGGGSSWVETDFADLTSSDVFVLATPAGYALPSNGGNAKPVVSAITVSAGKITSTVTDGLKWNMSGNSTDGYTFYPNGTTSTWLCCTTTASSGTNDNIRINNSGSRKVWITDSDGDLKTKDTYTDRWLCCYNSADFRGYTASNVTSDIISKCYKYSSGTTYYMTSLVCCTPLASINGSFSFTSVGTTGATANWGWTGATTGISKNILKVYKESDNSLVATIDNISASATSQAITGLDPCTEYYVKLSTVSSGGGYCDGVADQTGASHVTFTTSSYTVTKTGVTNVTAASLSAIPATTCASGFGPITIEAASGYVLPATVTVTGATGSWTQASGSLTISSVTGNVSITITPTCVPPVVAGDPADASYYVGDSPDALSVSATLASGTLTYLWKVSTDNGDSWSNAAGTNNLATYSGASLTTASAGTIKFKCIVGNSQGGCTVESAVATITVSNASYFPNGKTIFIQAESTSAWTGGGCVKAWFHTAGGSETAQSTYWLFDATGGDAGKKLFATVVPATGDLPYLDIQRFAANCSDWWNKNGGCSYSDANGSNTIRSTGKHDDSSDGDYIRWNVSGVTIDLYGDPSGDEWASSLASFSDQGAGVWTATYENYAPANAAGESQDFKAKTNYNGWIGNTGSNNNATLDGMHVGSTYNITATLDVTDHSLTMSKTFVKGEVSFDLQGHGSAISKLTNVTAGSKISAPSPAPTATGYTFGGWFTDPECTDEWNFATDEVDETMTLYAKWTTNVYTITKTLTNVANAGLPASFTYTGATTTALNSTFTVDATNFFLPSSIAVTMGGTPLTAGTHYTYNNSTGAFTFSAVITGNIVITATATAKLKSIAITTQPTTRKYFAGESFSSTGAVVTATMGDGSTKAVTASTTWTPSGALSAGTGQTVTATYTEAGIEKTATTTIDVYSVTVNKKNEDGDAVSADGVTATWTVGTKALAASASGASKYVFKQWEVTGASIGSTSSANTTLSNPTANVVVNAVFWKPRTVKWSVNGNDSYATGGPTTTVAYNGTISTVPTNPSGLACAGTFIAWTDAAHNNGTTAKPNASYYGAALYSAAGDFPNITAATTTFYAVFAEKTNSDGYKYIGDDGTLTDGKKYIFVSSKSAGSAYALKATDLAAPNSGNNGTAVSVTVTSNAEGVLVTTINTALEFEYVSSGTKLKYEVDGPATRYLFINGDGVGMKSDDSRSRYTTDAGLQGWNNKVTTYYDVYYNSTSGKFEKMASAGSRVYAFIKQTATYGNYVTECDANIVSVTYDANGGATSCANTTTDKTVDFTVCSSAPTRDYYTFAGWLCSADSKTYAASATIDADAIDADFTLTAQWTPVPYSITYELYGGTNSGSNPATYNVTTATITLQDPTKGHDRFEGWYSTYSAGVYSDQVTSIPLGSHGDITLHAKWAERHEIIFDADGAKTTIYRADDENMEDAVAGQGSVPSDPDAPSACDSKVFVGWSESEIDGETDTEPGDLMKPAAGTVDEDKHYYAVWATATPASIPATYAGTGVFKQITRMSQLETGTYYVLRGVNGSTKKAMGNTVSSGKMGCVTDPVSEGVITNPGVAIVWKLGGTKDAYTLYNQDASKYVEITSNSTGGYELKTDASTSYTVTVEDGHGFFFKSNHASANLRGISIYNASEFRSYILSDAKTLELYKMPKTIYTAYSTSCCATKIVLSDPSITDASTSGSTITFDKSSPVYTCGGTKTVTATLTLTAGYQASALSFAVNSGTVSISPAISTPITSSQVYTLTFAEDQNATLTTTATIAAKPLNSITITPSSGEVYVGQYVDFTVSYDPTDYISPGYTLNATPVYVTKESAAPANTKLRLKGGRGSGPGASITETVNETVTIKASGDNTKTASVNMTVNPLPRVHFEDLVHGKAFADVAATIVENALSATKNTPTSDDWTTPNANTCEENHLHLVGWIREDWPALVAYLNGTGDAPTTTAIVGAGNDGSGHAYYIAAGASINVQTFDGVTFYAVWAEIK